MLLEIRNAVVHGTGGAIGSAITGTFVNSPSGTFPSSSPIEEEERQT